MEQPTEQKTIDSNKELILKIKAHEYQSIYRAIEQLPYVVAAPILDNIKAQVLEQVNAAPAAPKQWLQPQHWHNYTQPI